eukprot:TRINITY_DN3594_c0_g5_i1.p1 TRINITY_DN3594_c0_g5~~TRINITY_DN3594_c0_g5_i1.p1  ORF type:complete len:699 (+),score=138.67 TRINITY_DN3594_c0_g5_i1:71-2098(+)
MSDSPTLAEDGSPPPPRPAVAGRIQAATKKLMRTQLALQKFVSPTPTVETPKSTPLTGRQPRLGAGKKRAAVPAKTLAAKVDTEATKHFTFRNKLACLIDPSQPQPNVYFARAASVIAAMLFILILVSVANFCIDSLPRYQQGRNPTLQLVETFCVAVFTLEVIAKLIATEPFRSFWTDGYNWIDIAAILPFYVERIFGGGINLVFLRVVRLARVFRMLKLGQYSRPLQMVIIVLQNSVDAVFLLVFLLFVCVILFASLMWLAEQTTADWKANESIWIRHDGRPSKFQSIPDATWWCMVTLTTVGYGDQSPVSEWGKVVGSFCMIVGLFVLAFPVILISYHYSELDRDMMLRELGYPAGSQPLFCMECGRPRAQIDGALTPSSPYERESADPRKGSSELGFERFAVGDSARPTRLPESAKARWDRDPRAAHAADAPPLSAAPAAAAPAEAPLRPPAPLPPPGSVVCHWRPEANGVPAAVHYEGILSGAPQFRYAPLFTPVLCPNGELAITLFSDAAAGVFFLGVRVCLDHPVASQRVAEAVVSSRLFDDPSHGPVIPECCFARPLSSLALRIPQLPGSSVLTVTEWASPGDTIGVHISAPDADALQRLQQRLPQMTLHFSGLFKDPPAHRLSAGAAHVPGQVVQDGGGGGSEPDIECSVPLLLSRRRSPSNAEAT